MYDFILIHCTYARNTDIGIAVLGVYCLLTNLWLTFFIIFVVGGMIGIGKLEGRDLDVGFARAVCGQLKPTSVHD